jgi:hypothetical protein
MSSLRIETQPSREAGREAVIHAVTEAIQAATGQMIGPLPAALQVEGIFAWYSATERRTFLTRVLGNGYCEFHPSYVAIGGPHVLARFALSRTAFLEYGTLPLEAAKMVIFDAADETIRAASTGVGLPVQMAVSTAEKSELLSAMDVRGQEDTVAAFREYQRDYLVRDEERASEQDTGLRP